MIAGRPLGRLLWLALTLLFVVSPAGSQQLQVHHIDVAQGDCTLIMSPTGKTVLIDAGDQGWGKRAVLPYLRKMGVKRLDYVIASHYDKDHIGGLDEVILGLGVKNIGIVYDRDQCHLLLRQGSTGTTRQLPRAGARRRSSVSASIWAAAQR